METTEKQTSNAAQIDHPTSMTLSARLRSETRDLHGAMESLVELLRPDLRLDQYLRFLQRSYGFYRPLESALGRIAGLETVCSDFALRLGKTALLERDLRALHMPSEQIENLELCSGLPSLCEAAQGLGCLYVVEGSTLGGAFLSRHVSDVLGVGPESGCAFLASYGDDRGKMWSRLGNALNAAPQESRDTVVAAARETFMKFYDWLKEDELNEVEPVARV